jgi:chloride channel protein, CIC family
MRRYVADHWRRFLRVREQLRFNEPTIHLMLAGIVGVIGGLTNWIFYLLIESVKGGVHGTTGDLVEIAKALEPWQRGVVPMLGGLAAGLVLFWGARLVRDKRSTNFMEVVAAGDGKLPMRVTLTKGLSSLLSIGSGASIGREGAITQLTAMFASKLGQVAHWQPYRLRLLVACGAAAGMAAAYNAPIAGSVFAAAIVLGNFSMNLFGPLVFSAVMATIVSRHFFGIDPWYVVPAYDFTELAQLPWFVLLGVFAGGVGTMFLRMLHYTSLWFKKMPGPDYLRIMVGGLLVGLISIFYPEVWGNGYGATNEILGGNLALTALLGLFLAKLVATLCSVGSGTVGGVFTPTIFVGAGAGAFFGTCLHQWGFADNIPTAVFALVGMGSVLAGTLHSPLLAMIMAFEISGNYSLVPALMLACAVSSMIARSIHPDSIYTEALSRKGVDDDSETASDGAATQQKVGDLMIDPVPALAENTTLQQIAQRFLTSPYNFLPVVDKEDKLVGIVALQDLKEHLNAAGEIGYQAIIAMDVMRSRPPCLTPNLRLSDALPTLLQSEQRRVPVVNNRRENKLIGSVDKSEALGILSEAIAQGSSVNT